jgi:flagellar hook-basal body complex protein FliE
MDVTPIEWMPPLAPELAPGARSGAPPGPSFGELLRDALVQVNALQREADGAIQALATGASGSLRDTKLAIEGAELSFRLMMQIRNELVEAYQQLLHMQV